MPVGISVYCVANIINIAHMYYLVDFSRNNVTMFNFATTRNLPICSSDGNHGYRTFYVANYSDSFVV